MRSFAVSASIFALLALVLLPLGSVWVGQFELTITIDSHLLIDKASVRVATCRNEREAVHVVENPAFHDDEFRPLFELDSDRLVIALPCSGRDRVFGLVSTYNQPPFIVVEYRTNDEGGVRRSYKRFAIPHGQGPRSMTIKIP